MDWHLRPARMDDVPALEELIPLSVRALQGAHYSPAQIDAALGPVFGVDRQLIADGTYFVAEHDGQIIGCGGWSKRKAVFGGDRAPTGRGAASAKLQAISDSTPRAMSRKASVPPGIIFQSGREPTPTSERRASVRGEGGLRPSSRWHSP